MRTLSRAVAPRRPFRPRPLAHAMLSSSRAPPPPAATDGPPPDVEAVVLAVHAAPHKAVVYATGGGAQALAWLLTVPGASATLLEARVPYGGRRSWADALGPGAPLPASLASADGAAALAAAAYRQAASLADGAPPLVGVGLAAALATERERRGSDRVHVAAHSGAGVVAAALELPRPTPRDRAAQDGLASRLLLRTLAAACGVGGPALELGLLEGEALTEAFTPAPDPVAALLAGAASCVEFGPDPAVPPIVDAPRGAGRLYLPGSFNPLHAGHAKGLAAALAVATAAARAADPAAPPPAPAYELAVVNADKGVLAEGDVRARVAQFRAAGATVVLTRAPLFADKAALFGPGAAFVVGVDTADRLVDPKYYPGGGPGGVGAALGALAARGVKVYVLGRAAPDGAAFRTLADVAVPAEVAGLGLFVGVDGFREDVSSTALRAAGAGVVVGGGPPAGA